MNISQSVFIRSDAANEREPTMKKGANMNATIRIESTEQLNIDAAEFGDASQVRIIADHQRGAVISVPACELEFVEAALEADDRVTKYVTTNESL